MFPLHLMDVCLTRIVAVGLEGTVAAVGTNSEEAAVVGLLISR